MAIAKRWCFTLFEYDESVLNHLSDCKEIDKLVYQEEKAPETGRLHIQGFCTLFKKTTVAQVKKFLRCESVHLEVAKGNDKQCYEYCTKSESKTGLFLFERGDFSIGGQGSRSDLHQVTEKIKEGKTLEQINEEFPTSVIKYGRGIQMSLSLYRSSKAPSSFERCCIVLYGPSGTGKSLWARQFAEERSLRLYSKPISTGGPCWFDGYDGEEILLLDDFESKQVPFRELLVWLDVYKHRVAVKGGYVLGLWKFVIITTNKPVGSWYDSGSTVHELDRSPLIRRLDHVLQTMEGEYATKVFDVKKEYAGRKPFVQAVEENKLGAIGDERDVRRERSLSPKRRNDGVVMSTTATEVLVSSTVATTPNFFPGCFDRFRFSPGLDSQEEKY